MHCTVAHPRSAALAGALAVALAGCPTAPAPLSESAYGQRGDASGTDTTPDTSDTSDTTQACVPECGGTIAAADWFSAKGWRFEAGAAPAPDGDAFVLGGGEAAAVMLGQSWSGGFALQVTFTVEDPGGPAAKVLFGAWQDTADAAQRPTVAAILSLGDQNTANATVSKLVGGDFKTADATDSVAVDPSGAVTITLNASCDAVGLAVAGGGTASDALGSAIPDVDAVFLQVRGGAAIRVTALSLTTACVGGDEPECSGLSCTDPDLTDCTAKDCTALGGCAELPRPNGAGCDDGDACTDQDACDGAGTCVAAAKDCDDDDACTADSCNAGQCVHDTIEAGATPDALVATPELDAAPLTRVQGVDDNDDAPSFALGDYVAVANPGTGGGGLTVSAWVRPEALPGAATQADIFSQALAGGGFWFCGLDPDGHVQFGAGGVTAISAAALEPRRWRHVACTYDPAADALRVFVDGAADGSVVAAGAFDPSTATAHTLLVGSRGSNTNQYLGALDEVRIWRAAVSTSTRCVGTKCDVPLCVAGAGCFADSRGDSGCDDGNECTTDACSPFGAGCTNVDVADDVPCQDGDGCTEGDSCQAGVCVSGELCPAADLCQPRECSAGTCLADTIDCSDDDPCTTNEVCVPATGECTADYVGNCFDDLTGWSARVELALLEPESAAGAGVMGPAASANSGSATSTWPRQGEPIEVTLWQGLADDGAVLAYYRMEETKTVQAGPDTLVGVPNELDANRVLGLRQVTGDETIAVSEATGYFGKGLVSGRAIGTQLDQLGTATAVTVMAWFEFAVAPPASRVISTVVGMGPTGVASITLGIAADGDWELTAAGVTATFPRSAGWHHLAFTYDQASGLLAAYHDGVEVAAETVVVDELGTSINFGDTSAPPVPAPNADDMIILDRALTPDEVRLVATSGVDAFSSVLPSGVALQSDYDDVMVMRADPTAGAHAVAHEVVGRKPHSDSGDGVAGVYGYWRFDNGSLAASRFQGGGEVVSSASVSVVAGAFDDPAGAAVLTTATAVLDKPWAFSGAFSVELWFKTQVNQACTGTTGGPVLLQTINGGAELGVGWALRVCDGAVRFDHVDSDQAYAITGTRPVGDGGWHHVVASVGEDYALLAVDGVLDGSRDAAGEPALDGSLNDATVLYGRDAALAAGPLMASTAVDEVLFFDHAKTVGYAYSRVYPLIPTVRFLADTATVGADEVLPHYAIYFGNAAATGTAPADGCDMLLSPCNGWIAWWRFDSLLADGGLTPDSAAGGYHLAVAGAALTTDAVNGAALICDGGQALVGPDTPGLRLDTWNLDAAVRPSGAAGVQVIASRPGGAPPAVAWELHLDGVGKVAHTFTTAADDTVAAEAGSVITDAWNFVGGSYTADPAATLTAYNAGAGTSDDITPSDAPPNGAGAVHIGARDDGTAPLSGSLDELRVMTRPLTPAQRLKYPALIWKIVPATP